VQLFLAGWLFSIKYDGYRCVAKKEGKSVSLLTRNGKDASSWYPQIIKSLQTVSGSFILDCEVCAVDNEGRPDFESLSPRPNGIKNGLVAGLFAFDVIYRKRDMRSEALVDRLDVLRTMLKAPRPNVLVVTHIETAGKELFDKVVELKMEGVMAKVASSPYVAGRSRSWLKFKRAGHHLGWKRS
jgi:bifunctional non-homologous end joining protein LigD